ncbi:hypothetical protein D3C87_1497520 [compost metagenome]
MADYWAAFARQGDPNGDGRPAWPAFEVGNEQVLVLDEVVRPGTLPNNVSLDVFDKVYDAIR